MTDDSDNDRLKKLQGGIQKRHVLVVVVVVMVIIIIIIIMTIQH